MENVNVNIPKLYNCNTCHISTSNKKDYICSACLKEYKSHAGLWKHKKVCLFINAYQEINNAISEKNVTENNDKIIEQSIKENADFKNSPDMQKQIVDVCKNTNITSVTKSNNKPFNLQFFLNEQCNEY
jgi:hypothetical protein